MAQKVGSNGWKKIVQKLVAFARVSDCYGHVYLLQKQKGFFGLPLSFDCRLYNIFMNTFIKESFYTNSKKYAVGQFIIGYPSLIAGASQILKFS